MNDTQRIIQFEKELKDILAKIVSDSRKSHEELERLLKQYGNIK